MTLEGQGSEGGVMFQLSNFEKLLVIGVCVSLLTVTVILTVCLVTPVCWLNECLHKRKGRRKYMYPNGALPADCKLTTLGRSMMGAPLNEGPTAKGIVLPELTGLVLKRKYTQDSTYSSMSTSSRGDASLSGISEASLEAAVSDPDVNYGQVSFSLRFKLEEGHETGQLVVVLKEAQDLPPRPYGGTCDPYLQVQVVKERTGKRRRSSRSASVTPMYEFRTSTKKKTQHPLYKETFVLELYKSELEDTILKVAAFDADKFANDSELGQVTVPLRDIDIEENAEEQLYTYDFREPKQEFGELLFGLSFLPTAERLTFSVVKANGLKCPFEDIQEFSPCVRILLFKNGKLLKKKKTTSRNGSLQPTFNETLTFDVPPAELDRLIFLVVVSHRDPAELSSPESPTSPNSSLVLGTSGRRDRHIGKIIVGPGGPALQHWNAMRQAPRKQVTQWHTLR